MANVYAGGHVSVTIGISEEQLVEELGVTRGALKNFFKILEQKRVALGKLCTGGCAERLAESGHDNRVQRMEVE
jgi:DNA-binding FadR family transcriptional regulator